MTRKAKRGGTSRAAPAPPSAAAAAAAATAARTPAPSPAGPIVERLQDAARQPIVQAIALVLALGLLLVQGIGSARTHTPTPDEFVYVPAGHYHLRTGDFAFDPTNPPLLKVAMALPLLAMDVALDTDPRWRDNSTGWGPWTFGTRFMEINRGVYLDAFFAARLVILAFGLALAFLVYVRARALLSPLAALATLLLFTTLPALVAHSAVATLDAGVTALLFAGFMALDRTAATRSWRWGALAGALFGFAFVAKGVAAVFAPVGAVLLAVGCGDWSRAGLLRLAGCVATMAVGAWIAILASYGFTGFPLPAPLVEGVRFQLAAGSAGEFPAFLGGEWSQRGWWYYYLAALVLKTPIATLALLAGGFAVVAWRRFRAPGDLWIVLPPLFLLYYLSFHYGKNYGIRYLLPALPFLVLLAGRGVDALLAAGRAGPLCAGLLVAWQVVACVVATPHHLSWFNALGGGPDRARRLLLDSNLDWGQDLGRLKLYLETQGNPKIGLGYFGHVDPALYGIDYSFPPPAPAPGRYAVSANYLAGYPYAITYAGPRILGVKRGVWSWLDRLEPVARVGDSIYVYDVTEDDVARLGTTPAPATAPGGAR